MQGTAPKELFTSQIDMVNTREILDALILLANSDKFLRELYDTKFYLLLNIVKCPAFGETQTKVDTISGQLASVEMDGPVLTTDAEEEEKKQTEEVLPTADVEDLD